MPKIYLILSRPNLPSKDCSAISIGAVNNDDLHVIKMSKHINPHICLMGIWWNRSQERHMNVFVRKSRISRGYAYNGDMVEAARVRYSSW